MPEIKEGDRVVPTPRTLSSATILKQLERRTKLTEEELKEGKIRVRVTHDNGQAIMAHPRLSEPFICHTKFFEPAPQ